MCNSMHTVTALARSPGRQMAKPLHTSPSLSPSAPHHAAAASNSQNKCLLARHPWQQGRPHGSACRAASRNSSLPPHSGPEASGSLAQHDLQAAAGSRRWVAQHPKNGNLLAPLCHMPGPASPGPTRPSAPAHARPSWHTAASACGAPAGRGTHSCKPTSKPPPLPHHHQITSNNHNPTPAQPPTPTPSPRTWFSLSYTARKGGGGATGAEPPARISRGSMSRP